MQKLRVQKKKKKEKKKKKFMMASKSNHWHEKKNIYFLYLSIDLIIKGECDWLITTSSQSFKSNKKME
jgi:hypothetical protein